MFPFLSSPSLFFSFPTTRCWENFKLYCKFPVSRIVLLSIYFLFSKKENHFFKNVGSLIHNFRSKWYEKLRLPRFSISLSCAVMQSWEEGFGAMTSQSTQKTNTGRAAAAHKQNELGVLFVCLLCLFL